MRKQDLNIEKIARRLYNEMYEIASDYDDYAINLTAETEYKGWIFQAVFDAYIKTEKYYIADRNDCPISRYCIDDITSEIKEFIITDDEGNEVVDDDLEDEIAKYIE